MPAARPVSVYEVEPVCPTWLPAAGVNPVAVDAVDVVAGHADVVGRGAPVRLAVLPETEAASADGAVGGWPSGRVTFSVTATVWGDPWAPAAVTVIVRRV